MSILSTLSQYFKNSPLKLLDLVLIFFFSIAILKLLSLNLNVSQDEENWEKFKEENHCELKTTETGVQSSTWVCDDGEIHYRWRQQR